MHNINILFDAIWSVLNYEFNDKQANCCYNFYIAWIEEEEQNGKDDYGGV